MDKWFAQNWPGFIYSIVIVSILLLAFAFGPYSPPLRAAPPAPPEVKPCESINTATLANGGVIEVFRCEPDNAPPYKINSLGFMLVEE